MWVLLSLFTNLSLLFVLLSFVTNNHYFSRTFFQKKEVNNNSKFLRIYFKKEKQLPTLLLLLKGIVHQARKTPKWMHLINFYLNIGLVKPTKPLIPFFFKENWLCRKIHLLSKKLISVSVIILPNKIVLLWKLFP